MQPFQIDFSATLLADLQLRLAQVRWPNTDGPGWQRGTNQAYLRELLAYWGQEFNWAKQQAQLNAFAQFRTSGPGEALHFVHERGHGPRPLPLLLSHGWPDSFYRFHKLIPLLTNPQAHGGRAEDAFDVVVPSLPGFGFSDPVPAQGAYYEHTAARLHALMAALGYARYGAHGGDVGSVVTERLALKQPAALVGMHLVNIPYPRTFVPPADASAEEQAYFRALQQWQLANGAYVRQQITKPFTLAPGLADSPAGLAAWLIEKFQAWSDCGGQVESRFSKDELLTNLMLYWGTNTIGSSFAPYYQNEGPPQGGGVPAREVPTGFAIFPHDIVPPPRALAERFYDVRQWTQLPQGGHFAALEEPELLAEDIRTFFRPLRAGS